MESDPLFERLQRALQPDYRLERVLDSGGMGIVFVAHDITLDRAVAIKTIRPELATAHAIEAFLREARILASVSHPNVVAIYKADEREGLPYYVMELISGPTLAQRLESGPLTIEHAVKLGKNLLDGLDAVHRAGVVHRDVKPNNIFMLPTRDVLGDFGIARTPVDTPRASPRGEVAAVGTPGYIPPEQLSGGPLTPRADLYSAGLVLYEAMTGRRYPPFGEGVSWSGIPHAIARVVRRALRDAPDERWPDARTFRRALWRAYVARYVARTIMLTTGALVIGAVGMWSFNRWSPGPADGLTVALPRFGYSGPKSERIIADSLWQLVHAELGAHPDFRVTRARGDFVIRGRVAVDSEVRVELGDVPATLRAPRDAWPVLRDSVVYRILLTVWDSKSPLAPSLPIRALPRTPLGLGRFLRAEQLVASAEWESAYRAYQLAEETDSTCWLCSWRISEVERWLSMEHDPERARRYRSHVDSFPPSYASLIRAGQLPLGARLDTLRRVTERDRKFFLGWFQWGDELFHRGPLAGQRRANAIVPLATAARKRPDFAPAWEHLAWVSIAEGDSAEAARALDSLDRRYSTRDSYSQTLRALLGVAFAWRFLPKEQALEFTRGALADPVIAASPDLGAGPRLLGAFEAPAGEIAFGQLLAQSSARDLRRSGLIGEVLGTVAAGLPERARERARRLTAVSPDPDIVRFVAELDMALAWAEGRGTPPAAERFARTISQLSRAAQRVQLGDTAGARAALRWHEHTDVIGLPTGDPQAAEIDWAFGTLARWRLARLLDRVTDQAEACTNYRSVARLWSGGEPLYKARADSAQIRARELGCL